MARRPAPQFRRRLNFPARLRGSLWLGSRSPHALARCAAEEFPAPQQAVSAVISGFRRVTPRIHVNSPIRTVRKSGTRNSIESRCASELSRYPAVRSPGAALRVLPGKTCPLSTPGPIVSAARLRAGVIFPGRASLVKSSTYSGSMASLTFRARQRLDDGRAAVRLTAHF